MLLDDYLKAVTRSPGVYNDAYNGPGVVDADIDISQIEALPGERAIVLHVRGDSFSERQSLQQDVVLVIDLHDKAVVQLSWDTETELVVLVLLELVFERAESRLVVGEAYSVHITLHHKAEGIRATLRIIHLQEYRTELLMQTKRVISELIETLDGIMMAEDAVALIAATDLKRVVMLDLIYPSGIGGHIHKPFPHRVLIEVRIIPDIYLFGKDAAVVVCRYRHIPRDRFALPYEDVKPTRAVHPVLFHTREAEQGCQQARYATYKSSLHNKSLSISRLGEDSHLLAFPPRTKPPARFLITLHCWTPLPSCSPSHRTTCSLSPHRHPEM